MRPVARVLDRSVAYVRWGKKIIFVGGFIYEGSPDVFAGELPVARFGDSVFYDSGHVGTIVGRTARRTYINFRPAALLNSRVYGPGILKGWITQGSTNVFAG